ncbi:MAG: hypothetical protein LBE13_03360 [Bacteroidales bacterium]|nr:hypothetical protein [Bacteroidales bacterium]
MRGLEPIPLGKRDYGKLQKSRIDQAQRDGKAMLYLAGMRNKGIKFRPDWNSAVTADQWLAHKLDTEDPKVKAYYDKWSVEVADLDDDENTPDNVVIFSDKPNQIVKSVDGYYLVQPNRKQTLRGYYTNVPDREIRAEISSNPEFKKKVKAYYKTHQTPDSWNQDSFEKFRHRIFKTNFEAIREAVESYLNEKGFIRHTSKHDGTVIPKKYMGILQKITSKLQRYWMLHFGVQVMKIEGLTENYNFEKDEHGIKRRLKRYNGQEFYEWILSNNKLPNLYDDDMKYIDDNINAISEAKPFYVKITNQGVENEWKITDPDVTNYVENTKKRLEDRDAKRLKFRNNPTFSFDPNALKKP